MAYSSGRTELLESLAGVRQLLAGSLAINGTAVGLSAVTDAVKHGIVLVPEDRQRDGLIPKMSIRENIAVGARHDFLLSRERQLVQVQKLVKELNIAASDLELPVTSLSGGDQQKVLIARCLMRNPSLLLLDEPTRGVDVGAKAEIYAILRRLADQGLAYTRQRSNKPGHWQTGRSFLCQGRISAEFSQVKSPMSRSSQRPILS